MTQVIKRKNKRCIVDGCVRAHKAKGYCTIHYDRYRRGYDLTSPINVYEQKCIIDDCIETNISSRMHDGYCNIHYNRMKQHGDPYWVPDIAPWGTGSISYGYRVITKDGIKMFEHRRVMEKYLHRALLPDENVHHINGDKLDNRIENLELWTIKQPCGKRPQDLVAYAKEILSQYEDIDYDTYRW